MSEEERKFPDNKLPNLHVMREVSLFPFLFYVKFAGDYAEIYVTIPGVAAFRLEAKMPSLADFFFKYGRAFGEMVGYRM